MSPPGPGVPSGIVAAGVWVTASIRLSDPSPWFSVQMAPAPAVRKRGCGPVGIVPVTAPVAASIAVTAAPAASVSQTVPSRWSGLKEPGGVATRCRTVLSVGSMRAKVPSLSSTSQTLSRLVAIPPSGAAGPMSRIA